MKKVFLIFCLVFLAFSFSAFAQKKKENLQIEKILEIDAKRNLDVAWHYFKIRKAYKAVLLRAEVTIAAHPTFSKMDEILYLTGMSSYYLSIGKGKQKLNYATLSKDEKKRFASKRLHEDAVAVLSMLVEKYPNSKYKKKAKKTLKKITPKE